MAVGVWQSSKFLLLLRTFPVILLGAAAVLSFSAKRSQGANGRPRIGLVMNGEGAVGFAQIGVLQWFEEHHIPVDYVAGTSVGGLIAGGYAAGKSPAEISQFVDSIDFSTALFLGDAPYQDKGNWNKSESIKMPGVPG